ncbi:unnamed protein product [Mycena citricolor]|uniref:CCHC-type domain-containing protein n=1 Tax=Mycena citricolor TaxID=2018698 RepID=A0AAD2K4F9_9AGAR|nr:unnamed protein product [Mycena citricolor]
MGRLYHIVYNRVRWACPNLLFPSRNYVSRWISTTLHLLTDNLQQLIHKYAPPGTGTVSPGLDAIRPSARSADGLLCPRIVDTPPANLCAVRAFFGLLERLCLNPPLWRRALGGCEPWHRPGEAARMEKRCATRDTAVSLPPLTMSRAEREQADQRKAEEERDERERASGNKLWSAYIAEAQNYDQGLLEGWRSEMDGMLIFAGLFSGVITTFIIDSYKTLNPDSGSQTVVLLTQTVALLGQISVQLAHMNNGTAIADALPPAAAFSPPASSLVCNALWFTSLALSLSSALVATLVKQWAQQYQHRTSMFSSPSVRARVYMYLYYGLRRFNMHVVVGVPPLLLHAALLLFFADGEWSTQIKKHRTTPFAKAISISITLSSPNDPPVGVIQYPVNTWEFFGPPYLPLSSVADDDIFRIGDLENPDSYQEQGNFTTALHVLFGENLVVDPSLYYQIEDVIEFLPIMSGIEKLNNNILNMFDGTNWNTWSDNYMSICMHQGTWGVDDPPLVRVYITQNLRKGIFMDSQRERTACEVFAKMATDYGQPNAIDAFVEYRLLNTTTFHGGDTIEKQIMEMETRCRQCSEGGIEIPDYLFATLMLAALPASSRGFVTSYLANRPIASLNPVDVKNSVIGNIKIENLDTMSNSKISTVPSLATRCTHCNKSGHVAASCYKKYPNLKPNGQSSDKGKGKQDEGKKKKKKERKSGDGTSAVKEVVAAPAVAAASNRMHISSYLMSDSLKHIDDGIFVEEMGDDSKVRFLWDLGCTHHMTNTQSDLHNIRPIDTYVIVGVYS